MMPASASKKIESPSNLILSFFWLTVASGTLPCGLPCLVSSHRHMHTAFPADLQKFIVKGPELQFLKERRGSRDLKCSL